MTNQAKNYGAASVKRLENSRAEITGSISNEIWEKHRAKAIKNINESVTIDGFRKGMIPENILIAKVGEMAVLEEMAELALGPAYLDIIMDNKLDAIGKPAIQVTKLATGNPLEFKITTAIVPEISLPDYNKLAQEQIKKQNPDDVKLTSEEIENTIKNVISATPHTKAPSDGSGGHSPDHEKTVPAEAREVVETNPPELTDSLVKQLGPFSNVADFREKITAMLIEQKRAEAKDKTRMKIADAILAQIPVELPEIMIESELHRTEAQFRADIERMGVKIEDYLKHAKKTIEDIKKEWRPHAEKKAKLQLVLNKIAEKEKLFPSTEEVEHEVKHVLEHYKDSDKEGAHIYAETVLTNEKVFQFLEKPE
ncbi:hypothetical protein KGQ27_00440 [Patescibacteria group bacterium]|nr:hypothetical protein [Patescibacteria group bacterium]MDE1946681.1 hypothetical protein [Patescibacteria group bacterium]MDE2010634.1 hypothetical protein [Patescibacteria group bacterium]MDE2233306.1 hypothetical protein [Patescibacteria group bacterium]